MDQCSLKISVARTSLLRRLNPKQHVKVNTTDNLVYCWYWCFISYINILFISLFVFSLKLLSSLSLETVCDGYTVVLQYNTILKNGQYQHKTISPNSIQPFNLVSLAYFQLNIMTCFQKHTNVD